MTSRKPLKPVSRRDFLRQASIWGGTLLASPLLQACRRFERIDPTMVPSHTASPASTSTAVSPSDTPPPSATQAGTLTTVQAAEVTVTPTQPSPSGGTLVALVKTQDRTEGVRRVMDLLEINPFIGKSVLVKPNFNSGDPAPASTDIEVLRTALLKIKAMNPARITVGDRSGMGSAGAIFKKIGGFELAGELGFDFIDFDDLATEDWEMVDPPGNHWTAKNSPMGPGFPFALPVLRSDKVVSLCCMKTHRYGGITMSLKNSVGMVAKRPGNVNFSYMQRLHSGDMAAMIAEINLAYDPALIVMDGVDAFTSGGPANGTRVSPGVVLAGTDRVAMDALGVAILKMHNSALPKISKTYHLDNAIQLGIGVDNPAAIQIITDDAESSQYAATLHQYLTDNWG